MTSPYDVCPVYENETWLLRPVEDADAPDLLLVYSDPKAVPLFNSDNCNGDTFHYTTSARMQAQIEFWKQDYRNRAYVRWTVIDKRIRRAIGTIELFNRQAADFYHDCGLLRLDLCSDYEQEGCIFSILSLLLPSAFELFECRMMATKIPPFACERKRAAARLGFSASQKPLIGGHDGRIYTDYYLLFKT